MFYKLVSVILNVVFMCNLLFRPRYFFFYPFFFLVLRVKPVPHACQDILYQWATSPSSNFFFLKRFGSKWFCFHFDLCTYRGAGKDFYSSLVSAIIRPLTSNNSKNIFFLSLFICKVRMEMLAWYASKYYVIKGKW
jgi:hypothetical protein